MEPHPSSRRSRQPRQPRQSETPAAHNISEDGEFLANQPVNFVGSVRSIPVNPRLQMHSMSFFIYSSTNLDFFPSCWSERT